MLERRALPVDLAVRGGRAGHVLLLVRASPALGSARRGGAALALWSGAWSRCSPSRRFWCGPDFDPAPWSPFLIAVAVGVVPGLVLVIGASLVGMRSVSDA